MSRGQLSVVGCSLFGTSSTLLPPITIDLIDLIALYFPLTLESKTSTGHSITLFIHPYHPLHTLIHYISSAINMFGEYLGCVVVKPSTVVLFESIWHSVFLLASFRHVEYTGMIP
jgi:hypothetical protein